MKTSIYLRIKTTSAIIAPARLWAREAFFTGSGINAFYYGLFFGIMGVMALYNLVLWVFIREHAYLYYVCYVLAAMFFQACMSGWGYRYLWTDSEWVKDHAIVLSAALSFLFAGGFVVRFLNLRETDRLGYRLAQLGVGSYVMLVYAFPFTSEAMVVAIAQPLGLFNCALVIWVGIRQWRWGSSLAKFFVWGWGILVIGTMVYTLMLAGFLPYNMLTRHLQEIGMMVEVVLLSFALAARINEEKQARRIALETSLSLAQRVNEANHEKLQAQELMNRELEARVEDRTGELQKALQELNIANQQLEQLSITDQLTGLRNRRYFDQHFEFLFYHARKHKAPLSLLVIDVDHFKRINDNYGHLAGDQCLKEVAVLLVKCVMRPDDCVVRYGGEEFVIVLQNTDLAGALRVAERARATIEATRWLWETTPLQVTISVGVADLHYGHDHRPRDLLVRADEAVYAAKQQGRNRVVVGEIVKSAL